MIMQTPVMNKFVVLVVKLVLVVKAKAIDSVLSKEANSNVKLLD